jgi:hypothetical protein
MKPLLLVRFAIPVLVLAGMSLVALCRSGRAEEPKNPAADRVKVVRATYEKLPPTILNIKEPIRVEQCTLQKVPVSHNLTLVDADEVYHSFNWWLDKGKFQNAEFDRIYWLYYKGIAGEREGKFLLAVRGPEEDALYGLLLRWAAAKEKVKEITLFDQSMLKSVNALLERLDERFAGEKPVLQK